MSRYSRLCSRRQTGIAAVLLVALAASAAWAGPTVSNVRASQRTDSSGMVDVYYDLTGASGSVKVDVLFSNDNGANWNVIPAQGLLSGDVGPGVSNGSNRHIVWDAGRDRALVYWTQTKAKVRAAELGQTITIMLPGNVPLEMVRIPAGTFLMGSGYDPDPNYRNTSEAPQHNVNIAYDFYMCKYEITQAQWWAVMGNAPSTSQYGNGPTYPVQTISWNDCQAFIAKLATLGIGTFRLPSETEWEYACRAGSTTRFHFGDDPALLPDYAWFTSNSSNTTHPVGQKPPNAFGLYDMLGNVWEWTQDWYHSNYDGAPTDGSAWETPSGSSRVLRGGAFYSGATNCRAASRDGYTPDGRSFNRGVRLVRTP